jgi:hypothetical protein
MSWVIAFCAGVLVAAAAAVWQERRTRLEEQNRWAETFVAQACELALLQRRLERLTEAAHFELWERNQ